MNRPSRSNLAMRATVSGGASGFWPSWPSPTKISPLGAVTMSHGVLSTGPVPSPATPGWPSVSKSSPAGLSLMTTWPFPVVAGSSGVGPRASVTHTFPSASTCRPCGKRKRPAPILATTRPAGSILRIGSRSDPAQLFEPHRSIAQTCRPSGSMSTPAVDPHVRPSGSSTQPSVVEYGLGRSLIGVTGSD